MGARQRIYDLPRQSRIAKRREVRANLLTAASDVGTSAALRNLGGSRRLAVEYRDAEYGEEPRPNWIAAALFLGMSQLVFVSLMSEATFAFRDGIKAVDPNVTGTFAWEGIRYLQDNVTVTFVNGEARIFGGAWTPLTWRSGSPRQWSSASSGESSRYCAGHEPRQVPDAVRTSAATFSRPYRARRAVSR